jgi:hypothetical protein
MELFTTVDYNKKMQSDGLSLPGEKNHLPVGVFQINKIEIYQK